MKLIARLTYINQDYAFPVQYGVFRRSLTDKEKRRLAEHVLKLILCSLDMDDFELIRRCIEGDARAKNELVTRFTRLIYHSIHTAYRLTGRSPEGDIVSDLHNEVFLNLFKDDCRALGSFEGRNNCTLASYIRTIAVRRTYDHIKKDSRFHRVEPREDETSQDIIERVADTSAAAGMRASDLSEPINKLLSMLKEAERRIIFYIYKDKLKAAEIADLVGINKEYVPVQHQRIREKLYKLAKQFNLLDELRDYLDDPEP